MYMFDKKYEISKLKRSTSQIKDKDLSRIAKSQVLLHSLSKQNSIFGGAVSTYATNKPPRPGTALKKKNIVPEPKETVKIKRPQSSRSSNKENQSTNESKDFKEDNDLRDSTQIEEIMKDYIEDDLHEIKLSLQEKPARQPLSLKKENYQTEYLQEDSFDEDPPAVDSHCRFTSILGRKQWLKFRQIFTMERPVRYKNSGYYFKLLNCENPLVRNTCEDNGLRESNSEKLEQHLVWSNCGVPSSVFSSLGRNQRINHFPASNELTRKDNLFKNIQRMQGNQGRRNFDFLPATQLMPGDSTLLVNEMQKNPNKQQIVKPTNMSQGKGIYITNKQAEILNRPQVIVSEQVANPLLVDDYKFDVRLQAIVTSQSPLKVQLQDEGLVRFATTKYVHPSCKNSSNNLQMHLTNQSINKFADNFTENKDADDDANGNKWSWTAFQKFLRENEIDTEPLLAQIEKIILKSIIAVEPHVTQACNNYVPWRNNCFEVYGQDILIDDTLKPYLVEVNLSPSMACASPLDLKIKGSLMRDLQNLVGMVSNESKDNFSKHERNPTKSAVNSLFHTSRTSFNFKPSSRPGSAKPKPSLKEHKKSEDKEEKDKAVSWTHFNQILSEQFQLDPDSIGKEEKFLLKEFQDELGRMKNMKQIFPCSEYQEYKQFFETENKVNELASNFYNKGKVRKMSTLKKRSASSQKIPTYSMSKTGSLKRVIPDNDDVETKADE